MFHTIEIRNLRGLRQLRVDQLSRVNLFFGQNNSGKSSILEAIFLLSGPSNPQLAPRINQNRGLSEVHPNALINLFYGNNRAENILLRAEGDNTRQLRINLSPVANTDFSFTSSNLVERNWSWSHRFEQGGKSLSAQLLLMEQEGKMAFKTEQAEGYVETLYCEYLSATRPRSTFEGLSLIVRNKQEQELCEVLRIVEPRLRDLVISNDQVMVDLGFDQRFPLQTLGDGVQKVLAIVLALYNCVGGILLIDELDNGLHHSIVDQLWRVVFRLAKKKDVQVFATTHSLDVIKGFSNIGDAEGASYKIVRQASTDEVRAFRYSPEELSYLQQQTIEMR